MDAGGYADRGSQILQRLLFFRAFVWFRQDSLPCRFSVLLWDIGQQDERPTFVTHLECSATGEHYAADQAQGLSEAGKPLLVRYDLDGLAGAIDKQTLAGRSGGFWRYREFLPVRKAED